MSDEQQKDENVQQHQSLKEAAQNARAWLKEQFPEVFGGGGGVPLAIGIEKQIREKSDAEHRPSMRSIREALRLWTRHHKYLKALADKKPRHNIDGSVTEPVKDEHARFAREILRRRKEKTQKRHKNAQREAAEQPDAGKQDVEKPQVKKLSNDEPPATDQQKPQLNWGGKLTLKKKKANQ
ncbi:ProQ/FinO family protein [Halorhodospira halochloris]|uniref:ProQ/FinO family protein n=1 Tax=Halorhodospira halochloris TaxID=1052 RepID=UPI001EE92D03|nr:ProQ/FinO family protein [Halorhodospira halochloris]MCG5549175.1 ProQ/FinO family protein [Halorhodospira halochloris]